MNSTCSSLVGRKIAVTGGSGFLGSLLVERLATLQSEVLAVDFNPPLDRGNSTGVVFEKIDLSYLGNLKQCLESFQPDTIFHLASAPDGKESYDQIQAAIHQNLQLTVNVLEAFRSVGGELFIYGDSSKCYGYSTQAFSSCLPDRPLSSYAIAKSAGWNFCNYYRRLYGMRVVSIRPTLIYGPTQMKNLMSYVIDSVASGRSVIRLDGGEQTRDPLYCDDAVDAFLALALRGSTLSGKVITISGGHEISVKDLVALMLRIMGRTDVSIEIDPCRTRPTESPRNYCSNEEAKQLLAWEPKTPLEVGLRSTIGQLLAAAGSVVLK